MVLSIFDNIYLYLSDKYNKIVRNHALIWIFVLLIVLYFAYAYYCTSRGYTFSGMANFFNGGVSIGCYK
ncbi:hypothetical protein SSUR61_0429 [Streptococcus suis R61]|uniref:Uncharacterized protein n=1 Tax=Streptococcus suis R61 TaxID=996306 RepID=A0AA87F9Z1_STRSU|nr:hypothetical protein CVO91_08000 [Streptococcus suis]EHC03627.1 hypothetical protein SSUR61_0429 [Streptococcus suis R61]